jgi:hypothetical protein
MFGNVITFYVLVHMKHAVDFLFSLALQDI